MPAVLYELHDSRNLNVGGNTGGIVRRWISVGSTDEVEVYVAGLLISGTTWDGFVRSDIKVNFLGGPNALVEVTYGPAGAGGGDQATGHNPALGGTAPTNPTSPDDTTPLTSGYSFDTTGGTVRVTQSKETVESVGPLGGLVPNFKQAIGVTKDGVEGTDVVVPSLKWSRTVGRAGVDLPYLRTITNLVGKTNDAEFYGFPAGTTLYLGASGNFAQGEGWTITHQFASGENKGSIDVGGDITVASKKAWEYLWVAYDKEVVDDKVAPQPYAAYVERVYDEGNFVLLEIGSTGGA